MDERNTAPGRLASIQMILMRSARLRLVAALRLPTCKNKYVRESSCKPKPLIEMGIRVTRYERLYRPAINQNDT